MKARRRVMITMTVAMLCAAVTAQAGLIDSAKFVQIGDAGNAADTTGWGAVSYNYWISKTVVSVAEWQQFYNAFGSVGGVGTLSSLYTNLVGYGGTTAANAMAVRLSTAQAAQYCNWLTTGSATIGAYTIGADGAPTAVNRDYRNSDGLVYVIANENEWYKAAFYTGSGYSDYTDGSDIAPAQDKATGYWYGAKTASDSRPIDAGPAEQNGTYNMMGINWEWVERTGATTNIGTVARGGRNTPANTSRLTSQKIGTEGAQSGFRIVAIPEPATIGMVGLGAVVSLFIRRLQHRGM